MDFLIAEFGRISCSAARDGISSCGRLPDDPVGTGYLVVKGDQNTLLDGIHVISDEPVYRLQSSPCPVEGIASAAHEIGNREQNGSGILRRDIPDAAETMKKHKA
ncbi:MAG: hypothetical protein CVU57_24910 [Deltaproteobacteria bacterium HGW-Deltaproteobacteria-15]|jgi:hypothetical protein|nr:MAG: hypothetical protein CVU57_24910 [Deltaproteobacteria bacterium HGW-Deltaproteobacteria-15]